MMETMHKYSSAHSNNDIIQRLGKIPYDKSEKFLRSKKIMSSFQSLRNKLDDEKFPVQVLQEDEEVKKMAGYLKDLTGTLKDFEDGKLPDFPASKISNTAKDIENSLEIIADKIRKIQFVSKHPDDFKEFTSQLMLLKLFMQFIRGNVKVSEHNFEEAYDLFDKVNSRIKDLNLSKYWTTGQQLNSNLNSLGLNGIAEIFKESFEDLQSSRLYLCAQNWLGGNIKASKMAQIISEFLEENLKIMRDTAANTANISEIYARLLGELIAAGSSSHAVEMFDLIMSKLESDLEKNLPLKFKLIHQACVAHIKQGQYAEVEKLVQEHVDKAKPEDIGDIYSDILYQRGLAHLSLKGSEKAFECFSQALFYVGPESTFKADSKEFKSLLETLPKLSKFKLVYQACVAHIKQGQYAEVEKLVQEHVDKAKPEDIGDIYSDILYQQGVAFQHLEKKDEAFDCFGRAIKLAREQSSLKKDPETAKKLCGEAKKLGRGDVVYEYYQNFFASCNAQIFATRALRQDVDDFCKNSSIKSLKEILIEKEPTLSESDKESGCYTLLLNAAIALKLPNAVEKLLVEDHGNILVDLDNRLYSPITMALRSGEKTILDHVKQYIERLKAQIEKGVKKEEQVKKIVKGEDLQNLMTIMEFPQFENLNAKKTFDEYIKPLFLDTMPFEEFLSALGEDV